MVGIQRLSRCVQTPLQKKYILYIYIHFAIAIVHGDQKKQVTSCIRLLFSTANKKENRNKLHCGL